MTSPSLIGRLVFLIAAAIGLLPLGLLRLAGRAMGWLSHRMNSRECRVARRNLQMIYPMDTAAQTEQKLQAVLASTGQTVFETLLTWTRPRRCSLRLIRTVHGIEHLQAARAGGNGVLLATPHYGNWEMLLQFMAAQGPLSVVYKPPESVHMDSFLYLARNADTVHMVRAETGAMRPMLRALQRGETVGITPDQQPKQGGGEFIPFYGIPALTLSLIAKLANRSGAPVLFSFCERNADGSFDVHFGPDQAELRDPDLVTAMTVMNACVQAMAERDFRQYQWTYKRFSIRPDAAEKNPYK